MIPFNIPTRTGKEEQYVREVIEASDLGERSQYAVKCETWLRERLGRREVIATSSCTHSLDMVAHLLDIRPGDEIIMPSFTFVSTGTAFTLRGAVPVFVDIRADTLNIDETLIEAAITDRTRAIVVVHYAGVACEMDAILAIGKRRGIPVIEDAAHAIMAQYKGRPLGTLGDMGAISFDIMKNLCAAGQGGALVLNRPELMARAEIIAHKGTNRMAFYRGETNCYEWYDIGSLYTLNALNGAYLYANIEQAEAIQSQRLARWQAYHDGLKPLAAGQRLTLPVVPEGCRHNAHIFAIRLAGKDERDRFIAYMKEKQMLAMFHYMPLHLSPGGKKLGRAGGALTVTEHVADTLVRLPLFYGLSEDDVSRVVDAVTRFFKA